MTFRALGLAALAAGIATSLVALPARAQAGARCGEERWNVKVLQDPDAPRVASVAEPTTIAALTDIPRPDGSRPENARLPMELRLFRVRASLIRMLEQSDGDIHLVLADLRDPSVVLIAEIPDSACAPRSRRSSDYARAQTWVRAQPLPIEVEVEGVAFWDDHHGQAGMARNGIELHPVLRITPVLNRNDFLREEVGAVEVDTTAVRVWLNTSSKVYHCPGSANYGTTARGQFMPEPAAVRAGGRPAGGRPCR